LIIDVSIVFQTQQLFFILNSLFNLESIAPMGLLLFGLFIGLRHAIEPDHLAAISTIVTSYKGKNKIFYRIPLLGALWGLGHTLALFVSGIGVLIFAIKITPEVSNALELGVGIMLIYLAITSITKFNLIKIIDGIKQKDKNHSHLHYHSKPNIMHSHIHNHLEDAHNHEHKALIVGLIHGLAGSGALMLLVVSTVESTFDGLLYIITFGIGSILGMTCVSAFIGLPLMKIGERSKKVNKVIRFVFASIAFVIGIYIICELAYPLNL